MSEGKNPGKGQMSGGQMSGHVNRDEVAVWRLVDTHLTTYQRCPVSPRSVQWCQRCRVMAGQF